MVNDLFKNADDRPAWWPDNVAYSHDGVFGLNTSNRGLYDPKPALPVEPDFETLKKAVTAECMLYAACLVSLLSLMMNAIDRCNHA